MIQRTISLLTGGRKAEVPTDKWDPLAVRLEDAGGIKLDDAGVKKVLEASPASVFKIAGHISLVALTRLAEVGDREFHLIHTRSGENFLVPCGKSQALSCGEIQRYWGKDVVTASLHTHHRGTGILTPKPSFPDLWSTQVDPKMRSLLVTPESAMEYRVPADLDFRGMFEEWLKGNARELKLKPDSWVERAFAESSQRTQRDIMLRFYADYQSFCWEHDAVSLERVINSVPVSDRVLLDQEAF